MEEYQDMIHSLGNAIIVTLFSMKVIPFLMEACWLIVLPITVVLVDLWFGISESKQNNQKVRFSGACWKTLRKLMDYYTLLTLGFVIGHIIPESYNISVSEVCFYTLLFPAFFDTISILGHILKLKGIKLNLRTFLVKLGIGLVKTKSKEVGEVLEDTINNQKDGDEDNSN